jgi:serine/threonine protein kinase
MEPCVETSAATGAVSSRTLSSLVRSGAVNTRGAKLELLRQTTRGLQYLHGNRDLARFGLTHRDLKPDNVLVKRLRNGENVAKLAGEFCAHAPLPKLSRGRNITLDVTLTLTLPLPSSYAGP